MNPFIVRRAILVGLLGLMIGCARKPPSVLIISIDSLRADQLDAQFNGKPITPRLSALAQESLVFSHAISPAPWTTPALISLNTGLPALAHGVEEHDRALSSSVPTLAEQFKAAGYKTAAFVPAATLRAEYGFERGFDLYDFSNYGHDTLSSPELTSKVLARIESWKDQPFFIWVHLWDPHYNYLPPPPYNTTFEQGQRPKNEDVQCLKWVKQPMTPPEAQWLKGQYEGENLFTDTQVGQMVDRLRQLRDNKSVVLAVLADHGESFQEHGWLGHTNRVDETLIHVPMFLNWPGEIAPGRRDDLVTTASLGRTLLQLAGVKAADNFGREPALPLAPSSPPSGAGTAVLAQTLRQGCFTSLHEARFKLVLEHRTCRRELFDLQADPGETNDLAAQDPARVAAMNASLQKRMDEIASWKIPRASLAPEVVEGIESALRTLGYVGQTGADGKTEVVCVQAPDTKRRDLLGDAESSPCPEEGARRCFP
ncbi:MAG: sulfatase-like hydrolase/transferase [Acidobacteriota bacterium]